jgi:Flp pilus assembly protein TadB
VRRLTRLRLGRPGEPTDPPRAGPSGPGPLRPVAAGALAALAGWLLVGGLPGLLVAVLTIAVLPRLLGRLEPAAERERRCRLAADLPLAVDLLAACLAAGTTPANAVATVSEAVGGPLGSSLGRVSSAMRLGADPRAAWAPVASDRSLAPLARTMVRSLDSGAAMGPTLERAARDLRARRRSSSEAAARAVAVKAVAPLGACFLPAFVLLGIVPTVWGIAARTFTGWG